MSSGAPTERFCRNHPYRDAVGVCRRCRARLCVDCLTKIDGINYCRDCLAVQQQKTATKPVVNQPMERGIAWVLLPLLWVTTVLVVMAIGWLSGRLGL
jgi:hypothetical protein